MLVMHQQEEKSTHDNRQPNQMHHKDTNVPSRVCLAGGACVRARTSNSLALICSINMIVGNDSHTLPLDVHMCWLPGMMGVQ